MLVAQQFICPHCEGEGANDTLVSSCCGKKPSNHNTFCRECGEDCEWGLCPVCNGEGVIERDVEIESA